MSKKSFLILCIEICQKGHNSNMSRLGNETSKYYFQKITKFDLNTQLVSLGKTQENLTGWIIQSCKKHIVPGMKLIHYSLLHYEKKLWLRLTSQSTSYSHLESIQNYHMPKYLENSTMTTRHLNYQAKNT